MGGQGGRWIKSAQPRCARSLGPSVAALLGLVVSNTAEAHRVCLDFEFGEELYDASRAGGNQGSCSGNNPCSEPHWLCMNGQCRNDKGEDHGRDEGTRPFPAMHTLARVLDEDLFQTGDPLAVQWGWEMLDEDGCTEEFTSDASTFRLEYMLWSENPTEPDPFDRNFLLGYACDGMPNLSSCVQDPQPIGSITPNGSGDTIVTATFSDPGAVPDQAAHFPFWSMTFAESRLGQPDLLALADRRPVYVPVDQAGQIASGTATTRVFGGFPTTWSKGDGWHYKVSAAHEYAHAILQVLGIPGFGPPHLDYDFNSSSGHRLDSVEWQAAAALEAFANLYALATWHDLAGTPPFIYTFPQGGDLFGNNVPISVPLSSPICQIQSCGAGTAVELDWVSALVDFHRDASAPSLPHVLGMLAAAHDDSCIGLDQMMCTSTPACTWSTHAADACVGWPVNGATSDFWDAFDATMDPMGDAYLTSGEYSAWQTLADDWYIDQ